jgi:hypothetical protein
MRNIFQGPDYDWFFSVYKKEDEFTKLPLKKDE